MMDTITCTQCSKVIAYTNRKISRPSHDYLYSKKLTIEQRYSFLQRRKGIYCVTCYDEYMIKNGVIRP